MQVTQLPYLVFGNLPDYKCSTFVFVFELKNVCFHLLFVFLVKAHLETIDSSDNVVCVCVVSFSACPELLLIG